MAYGKKTGIRNPSIFSTETVNNAYTRQKSRLRNLNSKSRNQNPRSGTSGEVSPQGRNWEFAIAVPLRNRKFEWGQIKQYKLTSGRLNLAYDNPGLSAETRTPELGVISASGDNDQHNHPGKYAQFGDRVTVGPSTYPGYEGRIEHQRISGGYGNVPSEAMNVSGTYATRWNNGGLFLRDRLLQNKYNVSDPVTIYGSGLSDGWEVDYTYPNIQPCGYYRGLRSLNNYGMARYQKNTAAQVETFNNFYEIDATNGYFTVSMPTPEAIEFQQYWATSLEIDGLILPGQEVPLTKRYSTRLCDMWADGDYMTNSTYQPGNIKEETSGEVGYLLSIMYNTGVDSTARSLVRMKPFPVPASMWNSNDLYAHKWKFTGLYGFHHPGGFRSNYGQALLVVDHRGYADTSDSATLGKINQFITQNRGSMDVKDPATTYSYSKNLPLVSNTFYRLGAVYKAEIVKGEETALGDAQSNFYCALNMNENIGWGYNITDQAEIHLSLLSGVETSLGWSEAKVTGYVGNVQTDMDNVDNSMNPKPPNIEIGGYMKTATYGSGGLGTVGNLVVDNIYLEHQGDLQSTDQGYISMQTLPEIGSVNFSIMESSGMKSLELNNNSKVRVDTSGFGERMKYMVNADFANVPQSDWDNLQGLLRWQRAGHRLTFHPYIDDLPPCMVGYLYITNVVKSHWDLTRRSFHLQFEEAD